VPKHRLAEIRRFFEDYKKNENKAVQVDEIYGAEEAARAVRDAMEMYKDQYLPKRVRH
jgi:inorganic pyrophosphatase